MEHWTFEDYMKVSNSAFKNKEIIKKSNKVACYYCLNIYDATHIRDYTDDNTAICPFCDVDTIIGDATNYPIEDKNFLEHMYWYAFCRISMNEDHPECKLCYNQSDKSYNEK